MSVTIKRVESKKDLRAFVHFPLTLYKGVPQFVPSIRFDEMDTLNPKKNPAFDFSEAECYLAYKDGILAGRVAAIINHRANETWHHKEVRYGWFDFIDDREVSAALLDAVTRFGQEKGMETITGPLGFVDMDPEGMQVEGFDRMSTMALHYNYPYYMEHMEALGYEKEVDWLEYNIFIPEELPERYARFSKLVTEKYGVHVRKINRRDVRKEDIGNKLFDLINETYANIYNFTQIPEKMVKSLVGFYLGIINLDFVTLVEDEQKNIVAFGVTMPSITRALQKCKGRLFPFGWYYILRSMYWKFEPNIEMMLIGIKEEYRKKGVHALIFSDLIPRFAKSGFTYAETNAELEYNSAVRTLWGDLKFDQCKRRRIYKKSIK